MNSDTLPIEVIMEPGSNGAFVLRLRRVQGPTESPVNYYHDVMDLCDKKNSLMSDKERLEYIFSGLEKELAKRIVRMKPRTPNDVLEELRAEEYAEKLVGMHSRVRGAEASVSAVLTPDPVAREMKELKDLMKQMIGLMKGLVNVAELRAAFCSVLLKST